MRDFRNQTMEHLLSAASPHRGRPRSTATLAALLAALLALSVTSQAADRVDSADRALSFALQDTATTPIGQAIGALIDEHPGQAGVVALADGREAFAARMLLTEAATRSLDIQTYIWRGDSTGTLMFEQIRRAAERGVRVRLLIDDNGTSGLDPLLAMLDTHPNIEIRLFNPFKHRNSRWLGYLFAFNRLNRRMHNKSFTADGQSTIVGGRNIGDEYFSAGQDTSFADLDVLAVGSVVHEVSASFDRFWNSESAVGVSTVLAKTKPITLRAFSENAQAIANSAASAKYISALARLPLIQDLLAGRVAFEWTGVQLIADGPEKILQRHDRPDPSWVPDLVAMLGRPAQQIDIVSPYFVPGRRGTEEFAALAKRGVRVRVLTNSLAATDVVAVHAGYAKRRKPLLRAGVHIYELKPTGEITFFRRARVTGSSRASLHAKTVAVDRQRIVVGSFNIDPRSSVLNTEMGLVIDSPAMAEQLSVALDQIAPTFAYEVTLSERGQLRWIDSTQRTFDHEPEASAALRSLVFLLRCLPIDQLL